MRLRWLPSVASSLAAHRRFTIGKLSLRPLTQAPATSLTVDMVDTVLPRSMSTVSTYATLPRLHDLLIIPMPTKFLLSIAALVIGLPGVFLLFAPDVVLHTLGSAPDPTGELFTQIAGGLAVAIGLNNWMSRGAAVGGIYGRPLLMADLCAFFSAGLGLFKAPQPMAGHPIVIACSVLLLVCGAALGGSLFVQPKG